MDVGYNPEVNGARIRLAAYRYEATGLLRRLRHGLNNGGLGSYRRQCQLRRLRQVRHDLGPNPLAELKRHRLALSQDYLLSLSQLAREVDELLLAANN